jgi:hypothetical protein
MYEIAQPERRSTSSTGTLSSFFALADFRVV